MLLVAVAAGGGVGILRQAADEARQDGLVIERLRAIANEQSSLEWQAIAARGAADTLARRVRGKRLEVQRELSALESAPELRRALDEHQKALDSELTLLASGREDEALRVGETRVDPGLDRLLVALRAASEASAREARVATGRANAGSVGLLALAAAALVLLFLGLQRARRSLDDADKRALRESERWFRSLVQNATDVIVVVDRNGVIRYTTSSVGRTLGHPPESLLGRSLDELLHPDDRPSTGEAVERTRSRRPFECRMRRNDGSWIATECIRGPREDDVGGFILTARDISERKALEEELRYQAFHDTLTGLANRALFENKLDHALTIARRRGAAIAVLFLDLDNFKMVNDSLGHAAGDDLLRTTGERVLASLRASDTAARLGGDEFAVLLEDVGGEAAACEIAGRLLASLEQPFALGSRNVAIAASIGIALGPGLDSAAELMRNADLAMYTAKDAGGRGWSVFKPAMHESVLGRLELVGMLQEALELEQFELHYQPIVKLDTARLVGVEALLRWRHPTLGLLQPAQFLSLAEQTGLIVPIGRWVLAEACEAMRGWLDEQQGGDPLFLNVNLSMRQLRESSLADEVSRTLRESSIAAATLVLEITESMLADQTEGVLQQLQRLKALGVRLAVDDFGTGFSGLSYLQRFPIDMMKIDRSFVQHARREDPGSNLLRSIVQLGQNLHLEVVAEGIDRAEQVEELQAMGVHVGQGFLFSKPLEPDALSAVLAADARLDVQAAASSSMSAE